MFKTETSGDEWIRVECVLTGEELSPERDNHPRRSAQESAVNMAVKCHHIYNDRPPSPRGPVAE